MNRLYIKLGFSKFYALIFGLISTIAGFLFTWDAIGKGWGYLGIYTGSASMITAYFFSRIIIEKKNRYSDVRLYFTAILVGLFSHWLFLYEIFLLNYIKWKFFKVYYFSPPDDPLNGLYAALVSSAVSLLFFGWLAIPFSVWIMFLSNDYRQKNIR
jgi:hypothetical protein